MRNPVWLFVGFSTPILYLALFTPLLKHLAHLPSNAVLDLFLPGILALLAFSSGVSAGLLKLVPPPGPGLSSSFAAVPRRGPVTSPTEYVSMTLSALLLAVLPALGMSPTL